MPARKPTRTTSADRKTRTSSQTRRTQAARGPQKGNKRNAKKKQDNTKLFIGLGVGAFILLFIIIAAAASGGDKTPEQKSGELSANFLTISQRKEIYKRYNKEYDSISNDASDKLKNLSMEDRRKNGKTIQRIKANQQAYLPEKMKNLFEKKHKGITTNYIQKHVINAGDAGKL